MPKLTVALLAVVLVMFFQNCSIAHIFSQNSASSASSGGSGPGVDNGGQAYDGKPYIETAKCPDGSLIGSEIRLSSPTSAVLMRKNCQNIVPPQALAATDFTFDPSHPGQLIYQGIVLLVQVTPTPTAPLAKAYYQWNGPIQAFGESIVYFLDIDFGVSVLQQQKALGHLVVCLVTAGVTSDTDPDRSNYLPADIGNLTGSGTERWLDTRSASTRAVMAAKADRARAAGCTGLLWDQTDAHSNSSGFPLTAATQMDFNIYLAQLAHDRGMLAVLAHTADLAPTLEPYFDMQYSEGCYTKGYCGSFQNFADAGKPVFVAEFGSYNQSMCDQARAAGSTLWFTTPTSDGTRYEPCQ